MKELTEEQKANKVVHFKRVIKYRSWFGWVFAFVGGTLCVVGMNNIQAPMVILNGVLFLGYGLFMVWQAKRALSDIDKSIS
jgi:hypothetical protein